MGKDAINTILHNYVNNHVEINKIIDERTNFISNGSFSKINNLINRVNNISSMNGVNNANNVVCKKKISKHCLLFTSKDNDSSEIKIIHISSEETK